MSHSACYSDLTYRLFFFTCFLYLAKIEKDAFKIKRTEVGLLIKCVATFLLLNILLSSFLLNIFSISKFIHGGAVLFSIFKCPAVDSSYLVPYLISLVVIAPITEEILFRGLLQKWLIKKTGYMWIGILGSAIVFSLIHFSLTGVFFYFVCGCCCGFVYYKYNRLLFSVLCHFSWNLLTLFLIDKSIIITTSLAVIYVFFLTMLTLLVWSIVKDKTTEY